MGLQRKYPEQLILNGVTDAKTWALRTDYYKTPLLNRGTFSDGTIGNLAGGTFIGTIKFNVPAGEVWFLKKLAVNLQSDANGTFYVTNLLVDGVNLGTKGGVVFDTLYGALLPAVTSVEIVGTYGSIGTFLGTISGHVEGYYTRLDGYFPDS